MRHSRAFTLIELLIVVSVIAILAGIAIQNMLAAQIRSKVARNLADFRTLALAIEAYAADHNVHPRMAHWSFYSDPAFDRILGEQANGVMSKAISTPIAYISRAHLFDPFMESNTMAPIDERLYTYQDLGEYRRKRPASAFWGPAYGYYGPWRVGGVGPDGVFDHGFVNSAQLPYDPSNGTISYGNIWYSPRTADNPMPPVPLLLGVH